MSHSSPTSPLREDALSIWHSAVDAVRPEKLIPKVIENPSFGIREAVTKAPRIFVVGAGKAGAAMSAALEVALPECVDRMEGVVNVPAETVRPLRAIRLHAARPAGTNQPTEEGIEGTRQIQNLITSAGPEDI